MTGLSRVQTVPRVRKVPHPYEQIAEHYRRQIRAHVYAAGARFPSIADIAEEWDISLATAQRAVNALREGLWVRTEHGRATFVVDDPPP